MMDKVREALEKIKRRLEDPPLDEWSIRALVNIAHEALTTPQPEAREEDRKRLKHILNATDATDAQFLEIMGMYDALSLLAAKEGQEKRKPEPWENSIHGIPIYITPLLMDDRIFMSPATLNRLKMAMHYEPAASTTSEKPEEKRL